MKLPALAIAIAFALGIAIGQWPAVLTEITSRQLLAVSLLACLALLSAAVILVKRDLSAAGIVSLASWIALGLCGAAIANRPAPADHVLRLLDAGTFDKDAPLRWHGRLRDDPARLPWGVAFDIQLEGIDFEERFIPLQGGLRLSYSPRPEDASLLDVHQGETVTAVAQARLPQVFRDEGAFDRQAYLRDQGVDLTAGLRAPELMQLVAPAQPSAAAWLAQIRRRLRETLSTLLASSPKEAAVLRAMLLGDRSFLERSESVDFQKTGVFHVLVVAGLHVGAFSAFLFWLARKCRLSRFWTSLAILLCIVAYVAVIEQRPPVLRAALMTVVVLVALLFFRRVELLNSVALAGLALLVASPQFIADSSFQLSFLAMFCIAGLAAPWIAEKLQPYARGLRGWRDVTRDVSHPPRVAQFRIDLRSVAPFLESKLPATIAAHTANVGICVLAGGFLVAEMLVLTVTLQVGMLPLMARDFHRVTVSGLIANLVAVPITGILVPLGFATLLSALFFPKLAMVLSVPLGWLTGWLIHAISWISHFSRWSYRIPPPPSWLVFLFFAAAAALAISLRLPAPRSPRWLRLASFVLVGTATLLVATHPFAPQRQAGWLQVNILDVGQGDSLFLVSPRGHTLLVDAAGPFIDPYHRAQIRGSDPGEDAVSPYLWSRGFQKIDVVALTHAHQDHLGGLPAILENFRVGTLWIGREVAVEQQKQLETLAASKGTPVLHELRGDHLDWDGAQLDFLWPQIRPEEVAPAAKNDDSLVFRVRYGQRSFLLPGDAEKAAERALLSESPSDFLHSDVLKVGHHGSKNSTTPDFLAAVQPRLAVISVGEANPYGHPSQALLERLEQAGVLVLRTDQDGAIHVATDGKRFEASCFVACPRATALLNSPESQSPDHQQNAQQQ